MSDDEINALLEKAQDLAAEGIKATEEARAYAWCAKKHGLIHFAFYSFQRSAEMLEFIKER